MSRLRSVGEDPPDAGSEHLRRVHSSVWRHFIAHPNDRLQVVVSLATPQPDLSDVATGAALRGPGDLSIPDPSDVEAIADSVRKALSNLDVEILNWLPNSQSFVVELTAEQARQVSELSGILEIIPNEQLK